MVGLAFVGLVYMAAWMHETALRLFPDSPYAEEHRTEAPTKPAKD